MAVLSLNQKIAVGAVFVSAMFMNIMDITIVNVALPTIGRDFHIAPTAVDGVVIAYLVSLAVFIPASGWLGDRFGGKRVLLCAIVVFTFGSVLCGLAQDMTQLVVFRVIQGAGGGMMAPVGMAMLYRVFPPSERVRAASILTVADHHGAGARPGTRWLPGHESLVAVGLLRQPADRHRRGDLRCALSWSAPGPSTPAASTCPGSSWAAPGSGLAHVRRVGRTAQVLVVDRRHRLPAWRAPCCSPSSSWWSCGPPGRWWTCACCRDRLFRSTNCVMFLAAAAFLGMLYLIPLYFQDARGLSALQSGLSTFPEAFGVMIGAQFASRLHLPPHRPPTPHHRRADRTGAGHAAR